MDARTWTGVRRVKPCVCLFGGIVDGKRFAVQVVQLGTLFGVLLLQLRALLLHHSQQGLRALQLHLHFGQGLGQRLYLPVVLPGLHAR